MLLHATKATHGTIQIAHLRCPTSLLVSGRLATTYTVRSHWCGVSPESTTALLFSALYSSGEMWCSVFLGFANRTRQRRLGFFSSFHEPSSNDARNEDDAASHDSCMPQPVTILLQTDEQIAAVTWRQLVESHIVKVRAEIQPEQNGNDGTDAQLTTVVSRASVLSLPLRSCCFPLVCLRYVAPTGPEQHRLEESPIGDRPLQLSWQPQKVKAE